MRAPLFFATVASLSSAALLRGGPAPAQGSAPTAPCLLVGGTQASAFSFDGLGGAPSPLGASATGCGAGPGFMAFSLTQPGIVYSAAVSVLPPADGAAAADAVSGITTSRVECYGGPGGAALFTNLSHVATDGACHVAIHPSGRWVFSAAYNDGTIAWMPVLADGTLGAPAQQMPVGPKAHAVNFDASGRFVFVPCLGSDSVAQLVFDDATGALAWNPAGASAALPAGSGPRHMLFLPTNPRVAFVLCELASAVVPFAFDPVLGVLSQAGAPLPTTRPGLPAPSVQAAAELLASADGLFLYATNRAAPFGAGDNSVAVLPLTRGGALTGAVAQWATGDGAAGALSFPRHAALSFAPGQPWLFVVGQYSGAITVFARDAATGLLRQANATSALNVQPTFVGELFA
jgi:6-phosphogluconolactonase